MIQPVSCQDNNSLRFPKFHLYETQTTNIQLSQTVPWPSCQIFPLPSSLQAVYLKHILPIFIDFSLLAFIVDRCSTPSSLSSLSSLIKACLQI